MTTRWSSCSLRCVRIGTGRCGSSRSAAGPQPAVRGPAGHSGPARDLTQVINPCAVTGRPPNDAKSKEHLMTQFTVPGMSNKEGGEVADTAAEGIEPLQRPASHAEARPLERGRPELHRRARDDRPSGRAGPWLRRRSRRADRDAGQVSARHARRDHQRPHLGRLLGRARHRAGTPGRARSRLYRRHRGHPQEHRAGSGTSTRSPRTCSSAQSTELEKFQWFVRAHLENSGGQLANEGAKSEKAAASRAKKKAPVK